MPGLRQGLYGSSRDGAVLQRVLPALCLPPSGRSAAVSAGQQRKDAALLPLHPLRQVGRRDPGSGQAEEILLASLRAAVLEAFQKRRVSARTA